MTKITDFDAKPTGGHPRSWSDEPQGNRGRA
jgi:hypothetical protein